MAALEETVGQVLEVIVAKTLLEQELAAKAIMAVLEYQPK
jgi:hypothetical protein